MADEFESDEDIIREMANFRYVDEKGLVLILLFFFLACCVSVKRKKFNTLWGITLSKNINF